MTKKNTFLLFLITVLSFGFSQAVNAVPDGCPVEGALPMNIGPVNPVNGFPLYVQDSNGLAVEFCPDIADPDTNPTGVCIGDPVDPNNPFSVTIGFGAEGFMASAEAAIDVGDPDDGTGVGISALLVSGVELAFLTETPADGDQFPFTRLRIRVNVPAPGIYTVTHPWGQEIFMVDAVGPGQEVRESFDIEFAADTVYQGRIGPILTWDTFNLATGTLSDSALIGFIGDLNVEHTVIGSPCETNFFSVEGVGLDGNTPINLDGTGGNVVTTNLFAVSGKVFTGVVPAPLVVNRSSYTRQANNNGQVDVFANSAPTAGVTVSGGVNLPPGERPLIGAGNGAFFTSIPLADANILPATVNVTANNATNDPNTQVTLLTDFVSISQADYDATTSTLTIQATSSDGLVAQTLTAFGFGDLAGGSLAVTISAPPATVTVTSTAGGIDSKAVTVLPQIAVGENPVANPDSFQTAEDTPLIVAVPGVLTNDTDADSLVLEALLGSNAINGNVVLSLDGGFIYTPNLNFAGADSFTYTARDGDNNLSNLATVTITVGAANDPPAVNNDSATTDINTSVDILVLANDTDADGGIDPASVVAMAATVNGGTTTTSAVGVVSYTPPLDFIGTDSFTYTVADGLGVVSLPATVTVTVNEVVVEVITVIRAQFRNRRQEYRIDGASNVPAPNSIDIFIGSGTSGAQLGTAAVDALGTWSFRERNSANPPSGATTITIQSSGGAIVTVPLQIRR